MALAERIRKARRIAGMTQQALADALGVTRSAVSNWETAGGAQPATNRLSLLATALQVGFEWIATGRGEMRMGIAPSAASAVPVTVIDCPHELHLLQAYRGAPARVKALLQEMATLHTPARTRMIRGADGIPAPVRSMAGRR